MATRKAKNTIPDEQRQQAVATNDAPEKPKGNETGVPSLATVIRSIDRSSKDMLDLKNSLISAESPYLPNRQRLYDLYSYIENDGWLVGIRRGRFEPILNKSLRYKDGEKKIDAMQPLIDSLEFCEMCRELLDTDLWGITGIEFEPGPKFKWNKINRKHIKPKWRKITFEQSGTEGYDYDDMWNVWVVGDPKKLGLYLVMAFYVLLKRGVISDWAEYIEMYGLPVTVLKYEGYNEQDKLEGKKILQNSGAATKLLLPKTLDYEVVEAKTTSANGQLQDGFRGACNQEMSVAMLTVTETTSSSKSSGYAQSKTHSEGLAEIHKADMKWLLQMLNSDFFKSILKSYGYPVTETGRFEFDAEIDIDYLGKKYKIDIELVTRLKLPVSKKYFYDTYNLPQPKEGEELVEFEDAQILDDSGEDDTEEDDMPAKPPKPAKSKKKRQKQALQNLHDGKLQNLWNAFKAVFHEARS